MQLGVIGLGVMGMNLARNAARNGAQVVVYNRTTEKTDEFMKNHAKEGDFIATKTLEEFVAALKPSRAILMMVNAGAPVDAVIQSLLPMLSAGDTLIDAGNSFFHDSERRTKELSDKGIRFLGMGVSGGEEGALNGPSMMPGGSKDAYEQLKPLLTKMAASDGSSKGKCVAYIGEAGSGHFVKMIHNGIEYGDMQLICEAYHLLKTACGMSNAQLAVTFTEWNTGKDLDSFLIEITAKIFTKKDDTTGNDLVDMILDKAGQKGTGKWTTQTALDLGVMIPTITASVDARILSAHKDERVQAAALAGGMKLKPAKLKPEQIRAALFLSKICSYAQGMALIAKASKEFHWNVDMAEVCRIWKGGCIIRSSLLGVFEKAYKRNPQLQNLLLDEKVFKLFSSKHRKWRAVAANGVKSGVPLPAMTASLSYFDGYITANLPQNLLQAQRDFFGAHTYERNDKSGVFHTQWE